MSLSGMYVALCGGASQYDLGRIETRMVDDGPAITSRSGWLDAVKDYQGRTGKRSIGIDFDIQKRMWSLIKGIMASTRDPRLGGDNLPHYINDGNDTPFPSGQELFPILNDIVLSLYRKGNIDDGFLSHISHIITRAYYLNPGCNQIVTTEMGAGAISVQGHGIIRCSGIGIDLAPTFTMALRRHELNMERVRLEPLSLVRTRAPVAVLKLSSRAAQDLSRSVQASEITDRYGMTPDQRKAAIWTTSIVLGGGSLMMARRFAKRRR
jgi:hypothetical protein